MTVYIDNAATTQLWPEVVTGLTQLLNTYYLNADAIYAPAVEIKQLLEQARANVAGFLKVSSNEIIFTSGASEGNNMIIRGLIDFYNNRKHIITTEIEHSSVKDIFNYYEKLGYQIDRIKVNAEGIFDFQQFKECLRKDTLLVSIMHVNNEVGTILPIQEIAEYTKNNSQAFVHTDATQALAKVPLSLKNIDFCSFSAHKIGGLKGSGFIYKRSGTNLVPLIIGGQQEFNQRAGTSNYLYHILLAKTLRLAFSSDINKIKELDSYLTDELRKIKGVVVNKSVNNSPFITNISLANLTSQIAINALAKKGYLVSGQSTCSTNKQHYSLVLFNMGYSMSAASSSIRISLWYNNTLDDIKGFVVALKEVIDEYGK